jgi:hypothetical protein
MPILRKLWDIVANMNTESSVKALNMAKNKETKKTIDSSFRQRIAILCE